MEDISVRYMILGSCNVFGKKYYVCDEYCYWEQDGENVNSFGEEGPAVVEDSKMRVEKFRSHIRNRITHLRFNESCAFFGMKPELIFNHS
jgi:hypothetical protein